jgi:hypothetical protein
MMQSREPTDIYVDVLSKLQFELDGSEKWGDGYAVSYMTIGIVKSKSGQTYLLTNEGVGMAESLEEGDNLHVDMYRAENPDAINFALPEWSIKIDQKMLDRLLDDEDTKIVEQIELSKFIRTFGHRLENNFNLWKRKLEK